jgi:hypothetical protein
MNKVLKLARPHATRLVAIAVILGMYGFTQPPSLAGAGRAGLASQFSFTRSPLPELKGYPQHSVRSVSPSLQRISAWISSVGASVALNDLDGDGLPNDVCYVDTRIDKVVVAPAPGTPARYQPFALEPGPLAYDAATMAPMGCLPADMNEDGRMDILVYYWGRTPIAFLRQGDRGSKLDGNSYVRQEIMPSMERWYTNAATFADLDGDGHADLIIANYFQDGARILDANSTAPEQMQHSMSRAYNAGTKRLLLWAGATAGTKPSVQFKDVPGVFDDEVTHGWTLAVGAADLDGDLLPEIYFANDFGPDRLLHNESTPGHLQFSRLEGVKTLTTPNSKVLGRDSFKGMGVDFGDLNGDGRLDMFVSNITSQYALLESNFAWVSTGEIGLMRQGVAPYVDRSEQLGLSRSGWSWDARFGDFNNDGVPEILQATGFVKGDVSRWPELQELATGNDELLSNPASWPRFQPGDDVSGHQPNPFYMRAQDGRYYDLSAELGMDQPQVTRGIATADVDGDGKLDFAVANQWETSYFYHNESPNAGAFMGLHLLLPVSGGAAKTEVRTGHPDVNTFGHPAIGASATVHLPDGRSLVAQVDGGNGHSGKRSSDLQFGLGRVTQDTHLKVDLAWRDSKGQVHHQTLDVTPGWHTVMLGAGG